MFRSHTYQLLSIPYLSYKGRFDQVKMCRSKKETEKAVEGGQNRVAETQ